VRVTRAVAAHEPVRWSDVVFDSQDPAVGLRREMERTALLQEPATAMLSR
jgi:hypothetical protein